MLNGHRRWRTRASLAGLCAAASLAVSAGVLAGVPPSDGAAGRGQSALDVVAPAGEPGSAAPGTLEAAYRVWRQQSLVDENGLVPDGALMNARAHVAALRAAQFDRPGAAGLGPGSWTSLGPGNIGGRVRTIAIHPSYPDTMFAGSAGGGIWRTDDGGASWAPVDDFMANLAVTSIVFTPGAVFPTTGRTLSGAVAPAPTP